jgi:uncharacterized protein YndB with AHSA1/START domain
MISISKDIENKTLRVIRQFKAPLQKVWSAWTESDKIDQWWGPRPWYVKTKTMEFKNGGHWLYPMMGPAGETFWSVCTYADINTPDSFKWTSTFCDEHGKPNSDSASHWLMQFSEKDGITSVTVTLSFDSETHMKRLVEMGFEGGFTMGLNQLEELLG